MKPRSRSLLTIEGRFQPAQNNVNTIAKQVHPLEESPFIAFEVADYVELLQYDDVDPSRIQWIQAPSRDLIEHPHLTRADIRAVVPEAHNYR